MESIRPSTPSQACKKISKLVSGLDFFNYKFPKPMKEISRHYSSKGYVSLELDAQDYFLLVMKETYMTYQLKGKKRLFSQVLNCLTILLQ